MATIGNTKCVSKFDVCERVCAFVCEFVCVYMFLFKGEIVDIKVISAISDVTYNHVITRYITTVPADPQPGWSWKTAQWIRHD